MWPETAFPALLGEQFKHNELPIALAQFLHDRQLPSLPVRTVLTSPPDDHQLPVCIK